MSAIIERVARGSLSGLGALSGVSNPFGGSASDAEQVARGKELLKQLTIGGAMLGGGTGLAVALANYIKGLSDENDTYDSSKLNDDTLYVGVRKAASDGLNKWLLPGAAVAGGVLSMGGAYALTQALHGLLQRRRRKALLDEAQGEALAAADEEAQKAAADLTAADIVTAFPVAVPLLAAVASGGIAYAALDKAFPTVQRPKSKYPKRIRAVVDDGAMRDIDGVERDTMKAASTEEDAERTSRECLLMMVDSLPGTASVTSEFLAKVASVGVDHCVNDLYDNGLLTVADMYKGASAPQLDKLAAASLVSADPLLGPLLTHVAAAEFLDRLPGVAALCAGMDADTREKAAGLATLLYAAALRPEMIEKSSTVLPSVLLQQLSELVHHNTAGGGSVSDDTDAALTSDSGGAAGQAEGGGVGPGLKSRGKNDLIDDAMSDPNTINMR